MKSETRLDRLEELCAIYEYAFTQLDYLPTKTVANNVMIRIMDLDSKYEAIFRAEENEKNN